MAQNRYQLEGRSLPGILSEALRTHGHTARIVESEKVAAKGFLGVAGSPYYRATIEVDSGEKPDEFTQIVEHMVDPELEGDVTDIVAIHHQGIVEDEQPEFTHLIDDLRRSLRDPGSTALAAARNTAPPVNREPGALVVVTGLGADADAAASKLALLPGAVRWDLDRFATKTLAETRRSLREAQADAVRQGVPVLAIAPLNFPRPDVRSGADHPVIEDAAQLWVGIDVSRKTEDTKRWLTMLAQSRMIDAVIPLNAENTLTPESGHAHGLPVFN